MKLVICIGSSCHVKGSKKVSQAFERLINERKLKEKINLYGAFCMGNCQNGVSVSVDDKIFSVTPETAEEFFEKEIMPRI